MTVRDLKDKLSSLDDDYTINVQRSDGTQMEITEASQEGDHFTFWTDSSS
ncbi:MAG: hypothetical protein NVS1B10_02180 [Candidatus Saccharimonadales bacterium]